MNNNHYKKASATLSYRRSTFVPASPHVKTTFDVGQFVPLKCIEVLPGDDFSIDAKLLVRALTPLNPTMDDAFVTVCAIYTPHRVVFNQWNEVLGENNTTAWDQNTVTQVPTCNLGGYEANNDVYFDAVSSLGHHLGLPLINVKLVEDATSAQMLQRKPNIQVSVLPKRTYVENWNSWIRDENTQAPILFSKEQNESYSDFYSSEQYIPNIFSYEIQDGNAIVEYSGASYSMYSENNYSCYLLPANKRHDYFTSAYPEPQKGEAQEFIDAFLPVFASDSVPNKYDLIDSELPDSITRDAVAYMSINGTTPSAVTGLAIDGGELTGINQSGVTASGDELTPVNLFAYTQNIAATTINKLRQNIAVQHWLENSARGGSRINELLNVHFGIKPNPLQLNKSLYLGGFDIPLNATTVMTTAQGQDYIPGSTGGYIATGSKGNLCHSTFTEHGYIMIYVMVRTNQTYCQGIDKMWTRKDKFDFYWNEFAGVGASPILNKEIFVSGSNVDDEVFAYTDYAEEYRTFVNKVNGYLDPNAQSSLSSWTYANKFDALPAYGADFIKESVANFDRTLAVSSRMTDQLFGDFCFDIKMTREVPLDSTPGLRRI